MLEMSNHRSTSKPAKAISFLPLNLSECIDIIFLVFQFYASSFEAVIALLENGFEVFSEKARNVIFGAFQKPVGNDDELKALILSMRHRHHFGIDLFHIYSFFQIFLSID